jgi:hypothetical protein
MNVQHVSIDVIYKPTINAKKHVNNMNGKTYIVVNYDKMFVCYNDENMRKYRSVIFSFPGRKLLSFSPIKSYPNEHFIKSYSDRMDENLYINEFIEGYMVSLFFDKDSNSWELATKTRVGGHNKIYNNGYFKENSNDSVYTQFCRLLGYPDTANINHAGFLEHFSKNHSYTFVIRNKNFHHFINEEMMEIFLVAVYKINDDYAKYISPIEYERWSMFQPLLGLIHFPKKYQDILTSITSINDIKQDILDSNEVGYVITDTTNGKRTKIYSSIYYMSKLQHSLYPVTTYKTLCLNKINKRKTYTSLFKQEKQYIDRSQDLFVNFVDYLHVSYLDNYVYKRINRPSDKLHMLLNKIHNELYISKIQKGELSKVTKHNIREYLLNLDPIILYNFMIQ